MLTPRDRAIQRRVARPVRTALVTLMVVVLALLAVGGFAAYRVYTLGNHRFIDQAGPFFGVTEDLAVEMLNQETGVRGYVITGDPKTLAPYRQGRKYAKLELGLIQKDQSFDPRIPSDLRRMRREVRSLESFFASEIALVRTGPAGKRRAQARILGGKNHFDHLRAASGALIADAAAVIKRSHREQRSTLVKWWIALGVAGGLVVALAAGLLLRVPRRLITLVREEQHARRAAEQSADAARALTYVREAVVLVDQEGVVRYRNPTAVLWFGLGDGTTNSEALHRILAEFRTAEGGGGSRRVQLADEERWLTCSTTEFDAGKVAVFRDVSDDRRLERLRAEFVATAAHELRTPLAAVYGAVRTLRERRDLPGATNERFLELIEHESERLKTVIDQLLVSAQLDVAGLHLNRQPVDVASLCENLLLSAEARKPEDVHLALSRPEGNIVVTADPDRLRQIVANLLDNAIKYSPDGGRIELRVFAHDRFGVIEVADEGLGIPDSEQGRIFEKFYRLDPNMTKGVGGSGLGLYIAHELVQQMGGQLTLASRHEVGSTFTVGLPLARQDEATGHGDAAEPEGATAGPAA